MSRMFRIHYPEYLCSFDGRKIRGIEVKTHRPFGEYFAIDLGGSPGFLPSRIATKASPVLFGLIRGAEVGNDVDQRIGFSLIGIHRCPVGAVSYTHLTLPTKA